MPKRSAKKSKLDETLDLLNIESEKNVVLSNENKVLSDRIQDLEKENGIYISQSVVHFTKIEKLKSTIASLKRKKLSEDLDTINEEHEVNVLQEDNNDGHPKISQQVTSSPKISSPDTSSPNCDNDRKKESVPRKAVPHLFNISKEDRKIYRRKAREECNRIVEEMKKVEKGKSKNEKITEPKQLNMTYTVSKYISDIMTAGFTGDYLKSTKWSNQEAKKGKNLKKGMDAGDRESIIDLALTNWDSLSPIVSKETIKKWVIDGIKQTFNNKGRSTKVLNLAEKDPEDAVK